MFMKCLNYPSIHPLIVVFLNMIFHFFINSRIYHVIGNLIENLCHLFITVVDTVVENLLRSEFLHIVIQGQDRDG